MKYSLVGYLVTFGFVTLSTVISEFAQIVSTKYDKPFIIRYVNDSSNIFGLIVPFIWLCTTRLFAKKVNKDRAKLLKKKRDKAKHKGLTESVLNASQLSLSYQYQGSPMGMGGHPITIPPTNDSINNSNFSLEHGSLFNQSLISNDGSSIYNDTFDSRSITAASIASAPNDSLNNSLVSVKVTDLKDLSLNQKESDAMTKLITNSSTSSTMNKSKLPPVVKLHLFHPNPSQYKRYKHSLKHIHSTIHIALVKGRIYHFIPFLILVSWFYSGGGMLWYLSLTGTTVPTNTCLARFRVLFVFFLSAIFFNEAINLWKIIGIFCAFSSVALFAIEIESQKSDDSSSQTHDTLQGALLILLAALFSACGDVVYRIGATKTLNRDKIYGLQLIVTFFFNGLYGFVIATTFWGVFYIEPFVMPNTTDMYWILFVSIVLMLANVVQFISISMTSPFFLNVCLFLKIPLSFIIDIFVHDYKPGYYSISGGVLVIIGFLMLEIISPPKCCGKCREILLYSWCNKQIQTVRKRTHSFNIDIEREQ